MGSHLWERPDGDTDMHPTAELPGRRQETTIQLHPWCQLGKCAHIKDRYWKWSNILAVISLALLSWTLMQTVVSSLNQTIDTLNSMYITM